MAETKKLVKCAEDGCDTEVEIITKDGTFEGACPKCGLDMGGLLNKRRYAKALENLRKRDEVAAPPAPPAKKKSVLDEL